LTRRLYANIIRHTELFNRGWGDFPVDNGKRQQIILAGVRIFAARGYHAVNVEDVLRAADVSRATFYTHFKSKEDLFSDIVDLLLREQSTFILQLQEKFLSAHGDFAAVVESLVQTVVAEAERSRDVLLLFFDVIVGSGTRGEERFRQMQQVTIDHFTNMIQQHMQQQGYSAAAARALAYLLIGGLSHVGRAVLHGQLPDREIEQFVRGLNELLGKRVTASRRAPRAASKKRRKT
jgi:AcrR family transcriptional regulator